MIHPSSAGSSCPTRGQQNTESRAVTSEQGWEQSQVPVQSISPPLSRSVYATTQNQGIHLHNRQGHRAQACSSSAWQKSSRAGVAWQHGQLTQRPLWPPTIHRTPQKHTTHKSTAHKAPPKHIAPTQNYISPRFRLFTDRPTHPPTPTPLPTPAPHPGLLHLTTHAAPTRCTPAPGSPWSCPQAQPTPIPLPQAQLTHWPP